MSLADAKHNIKKDRLSHMSSPVNNDSEFHLRDSELGIIPDLKEQGFVCYPVICVTKGDDSGVPMHRFVQTGKASFHYAIKEGLDSKIKRVSDKVR